MLNNVTQSEAALIVAIIAGTFTALGWFVSYVLSQRKEISMTRRQNRLNYVKQQIEELYNPIYCLIQQTKYIYEISTLLLPVNDKNMVDKSKFSQSDSIKWQYLIEKYFLPLNSQVAVLLREKMHLIDGLDIPNSYLDFFKHEMYFSTLHTMWKETQKDLGDIGGYGWPKEFEKDICDTLSKLKVDYKNIYLNLKEVG